MISLFELLLSTKKRRFCFLFAIESFLMIFCLFNNFQVARQLMHFNLGNDIFKLMELKGYSECFYVRFLINAFESDMTILSLLKCFFASISIIGWVWIIFAFSFVIEGDLLSIKSLSNSVIVQVVLFATMNLAVIYNGVSAYTSLTTFAAANRLHLAGSILYYGSIGLVLIVLIILFLMIQNCINQEKKD